MLGCHQLRCCTLMPVWSFGDGFWFRGVLPWPERVFLACAGLRWPVWLKCCTQDCFRFGSVMYWQLCHEYGDQLKSFHIVFVQIFCTQIHTISAHLLSIYWVFPPKPPRVQPTNTVATQKPPENPPGAPLHRYGLIFWKAVTSKYWMILAVGGGCWWRGLSSILRKLISSKPYTHAPARTPGPRAGRYVAKQALYLCATVDKKLSLCRLQ